jgi:sarcosine oxidase
MEPGNFDVIVTGVGSMGSASCYWLAKRGYKVLGLEQFDIPNERGSHAGQSRIIRKAYFEHPGYVPLLKRAYENWQQLESLTGTEVYFRTGLVYHGKPGRDMIRGVKEAASLHKIKLDCLTRQQAALQFPQFTVPENFETIYEPDAGFLTPEKVVLLYKEEAIKAGAGIRTKEIVLEWKKENGVIKVVTDKNTYYSKKLIITAGAWTGKMLPELNTALTVTRQTIAWVQPKNPNAFSIGNFPCWLLEDEEKGTYYGFPVLPQDRFDGSAGLKVAHHYPGQIVDPDNVNRQINKEDEEDLRYALSKYLPGANAEVLAWKTCLYTYSKDENFIIDHLPGYDNDVTIACGFSGHGFKFVSVVGEIVADLAIKGNTGLPIDFLRLKRFQKIP